MTASRQKLAARVVLAIAVALGLAWLARLDYARKVSTDVMDLIPRDERSPELETARLLANAQQARVALFALEAPAPAGPRASQAFVAALRESPACAEVVRMDDTAPRDDLGRYVF